MPGTHFSSSTRKQGADNKSQAIHANSISATGKQAHTSSPPGIWFESKIFLPLNVPAVACEPSGTMPPRSSYTRFYHNDFVSSHANTFSLRCDTKSHISGRGRVGEYPLLVGALNVASPVCIGVIRVVLFRQVRHECLCRSLRRCCGPTSSRRRRHPSVSTAPMVTAGPNELSLRLEIPLLHTLRAIDHSLPCASQQKSWHDESNRVVKRRPCSPPSSRVTA